MLMKDNSVYVGGDGTLQQSGIFLCIRPDFILFLTSPELAWPNVSGHVFIDCGRHRMTEYRFSGGLSSSVQPWSCTVTTLMSVY